MCAKWVTVFALLSVALFITGCGGGRSDNEGIDAYEAEMGSGRRAAPSPGESEPAALPGLEPTGPSGAAKVVGDETGGGIYGKRVTVGDGQGGNLSQDTYMKVEQAGKEHKDAFALYKQYFDGKKSDNINKGLLESAIAQYDSLMDKVQALQEAHPKNPTIEEMATRVNEERRDLVMER